MYAMCACMYVCMYVCMHESGGMMMQESGGGRVIKDFSSIERLAGAIERVMEVVSSKGYTL